MRPVLMLLALCAVLALASPARAGSDVGVVVTGETWMQTQVVAQLEGWLIQHGHTLLPSPLPPDAIKALDDCLSAAERSDCVRGVVEQRATASNLLYARLDTRSGNGNGSAPDVTLAVYWSTKGHDTASLRKTCTHCTEQSLRAVADELLRKLVGGTELGHVVLKSAPPGARITIDGTAIGITPLDWDLPAGKHAIQMDKAGRTVASRDVTVQPGKSTLVVLTLAVPEGEPSESETRLVPLGLMVTGGALIVTGAVLFAIDEDPTADKHYYRDTGPLGVGLAIGGVAIGLAGAYLQWFRPSPAASAPIAAFTGDRAYVGWSGRF